MKALLVALAMTITACSTMQRDAASIRAASLSSGVCTLHHVRLREATVYEFAPVRVATLDGGVGYELHDKYPNSLPVEYQFKRDKYCRKPLRYRYCPICQQSYDSESK